VLKARLELKAKAKPSEDALKAAIASGDVDAATKALDSLIEINDGNVSTKIRKFQVLLKDLNAPDRAYPYGEQVAKEHWDEAQPLNNLAWFVLDTPGIAKRDLDFAMEIASRANEVTNGEDSMILDTFARAFYEKGDLKNAIRLQRKAVQFSKPGPMADEIAAVLKKYEDEMAAKAGAAN
jgi:hypothetical protein